MTRIKKGIIYSIIGILAVVVLATIGGSFYMLDFALAPEVNRSDTAACYKRLFDTYPETRQWVDSLREKEALRDTFVTMPTGERHHALYVDKGSSKTALIVHGWRDCAIDFLFLARIYELMGYNVVMPDLHAHGLSEGDMIQMGWRDRKDVLHWLSIFLTDTMVVHGVSMGAATTMMMSAEPLPKRIKDIRFVADCGYTSAWDEFEGELSNQFGLPPFPILHASSMLCKLQYGWSFGECSYMATATPSYRLGWFIAFLKRNRPKSRCGRQKEQGMRSRMGNTKRNMFSEYDNLSRGRVMKHFDLSHN